MQFDWNKLDYYEKEAVIRDAIYDNPYIPKEVIPHPKQALFLSDFTREVLYGGSAGGGKSCAALMAALMFKKYPNHKSMILRRTYYQLKQPEALIPVSMEWLTGTDAKWKDKENKWYFPNGSILAFGYMDSEKDKYNYQGSAFHDIIFDELTQFEESMYLYLFSRLRKVKTSEYPLRMRATSNPGGVGHEWVKKRFITGKGEDRIFIPAGLKDNPSLDEDEYRENLKNLDPVTRRQLEEGDWDVVGTGNFFMRSKFRFVERPEMGGRVVRFWDMAGSDKKKADWTVGVKMLMRGGQFFILDVVRVQAKPYDVEKLIRETAEIDGRHVSIYMEQEPGSAGIHLINHYSRNVLIGYAFEGVRTTGNKVERAKPFSAAVSNENVFLVTADWNQQFLEEISVFPQEGFHDDQCFVAGTKIATIFGDKNIEDIKVGDYVITPFGLNKVINSGLTGNKMVTTKGALTGTGKHPIFVYDEGFVPLDYTDNKRKDELCYKQLIRWMLLNLLHSMEKNTDLWEQREDIISVKQEQMQDEKILKGFMSLFMNIIQEKQFKKGLSFITKMVTHLITTSLIWNVYLLNNMVNFINQKTQKNKENISTTSDQKHQSGINQRKEENGTESMHKKQSVIDRLLNLFVLNVVNYFIQRLLTQNIVHQIAAIKEETKNALLLKENVKFVDQNLQQKGLKPQTELEGLVQEDVGLNYQNVYNLTVERAGVYYANKTLVSNCDAASGAFSQLIDSVLHVGKVLTLRVDRTSKVCKGY